VVTFDDIHAVADAGLILPATPGLANIRGIELAALDEKHADTR
jgi:hypothetical protein